MYTLHIGIHSTALKKQKMVWLYVSSGVWDSKPIVIRLSERSLHQTAFSSINKGKVPYPFCSCKAATSHQSPSFASRTLIWCLLCWPTFDLHSPTTYSRQNSSGLLLSFPWQITRQWNVFFWWKPGEGTRQSVEKNISLSYGFARRNDDKCVD